MLRAALYLTLCSVRNWFRMQLGRLRSPRYLLAIVLGSAYLWLIFFRRGGGGHSGLELSEAMIERLGALLLALTVARWWVFGVDSIALAFSPAEVQFLFPAPLLRRDLLLFKIVRAQVFLLLNAVVWTLLLRRDGGLLLHVLHGIALWTLFSVLFLHRLGTALTRATAVEWVRGSAGRKVLLGVPAAVIGAIVAILVARWWTGIAPEFTGDPRPIFSAFWNGLSSPVPTAILAPFALLTRAASSLDPAAWSRAILPAFAILALHFAWVIRADRAFEEAAISASVRRADLLQRWRSGGRAPSEEKVVGYSLPLPRRGPPLVAIIWKNLIRAWRDDRSTRLLFRILILLAALVGIFGPRSDAVSTAAAATGATWAAMLLFLGPQWVRNDLRGDLPRVALLRTFPLSGTSLVTAQVFSSAAVLTLLQLLLLGIAALGTWFTPDSPLGVMELIVGVIGSLLLLPPLNVIALGLQNAGAVLYPAWVGPQLRPGGIEALGHQLLTSGLCAVLLILAAAIPLALGAGVAVLTHAVMGVWAGLAGALVSGAALGLIGFLLLDWVGGAFERMDPAAVL